MQLTTLVLNAVLFLEITEQNTMQIEFALHVRAADRKTVTP